LAESKIRQTSVPLKDRISFLENELKTSRSLYEDQEKLAQDLVGKRDGLLKNLSEAEQDRQTLKVQVASLTARLGEMETALPAKLAQAKAPAETKLADQDAKIGQLNTLVAEKDAAYAKDIADLKARNAAMEQQMALVAKDKAALEKKFAAADTELKSFQGSINQRIEEAREPLEETLRSLEKNLFDKDTALKDKDAELLRLSKERNASLTKLAQSEEEKKTLSARIAMIDSEHKDLASNLEARIAEVKQPLQQKTDKLTVDMQAAQAELASVNRAFAEAQQKIAALENQLTFVANGKSDAEQTQAKLKEALKVKDADIQARIAQAIQEWQGKVKVLEDKLAAMDAGMQSKVALAKDASLQELAVLQQSVKQKDMLLNERELMLSQANLKIETLLKDVDMARQDKTAAEEDKAALSSKMEETAATAQTHQKNENELAQMREKLSGELALVKGEKAKLEQEYAQTVTQLSKSQGDDESKLAAAVKPLQDKIAAMAGQMDKLQAQLADQVAVSGDLKAEVGKLSQAKEAVLAENAALKQKIAEMKEVLSRRQSELDEAEKKIDTKKENLKAVQDELKGAMDLIK
ncbi:MAG: hypothetical protein HQL19_06260, partial [Candidatus Omnitrophica bacterium]|nr:hypothetical protein [Candidatus Omnitrophota bacterium]